MMPFLAALVLQEVLKILRGSMNVAYFAMAVTQLIDLALAVGLTQLLQLAHMLPGQPWIARASCHIFQHLEPGLIDHIISQSRIGIGPLLALHAVTAAGVTGLLVERI